MSLEFLRQINAWSLLDQQKIDFKYDDFGWFNAEGLVDWLIAELQPELIIEVGCYKGKSTIYIGQLIKKMGLSTKMICIDTWLGSCEHMSESDSFHPFKLYGQFLFNIKYCQLNNVVIPLQQTSANAGRILKKLNIKSNLIILDGSHEYEDVLLDLSLFSKLLSPGGVILLDDYNSCWTGVTRAIGEFMFRNGKNFTFKDFGNNTCAIQLKEA